MGEVFKQLAGQKESRIEEGHLLIDHVHMLIAIPPKYKTFVAQLIATLEAIEVDPDVRAKVIVDEKTGTIVIGEAVSLRPAAITFGALTVEVDETPTASQPVAPRGGGSTKLVPHSTVAVHEADNSMRMVKKAATVGDVDLRVQCTKIQQWPQSARSERPDMTADVGCGPPTLGL